MDILNYIDSLMEQLGVPYEFIEWTDDVTYPYFVGELTEPEPVTEDGLEEYTMILTGFSRGSVIELESIKETIKAHLNGAYGLRGQTETGTVVLFYGGAFYVPTGEAELKRIQITLNIKLWKGNI